MSYCNSSDRFGPFDVFYKSARILLVFGGKYLVRVPLPWLVLSRNAIHFKDLQVFLLFFFGRGVGHFRLSLQGSLFVVAHRVYFFHHIQEITWTVAQGHPYGQMATTGHGLLNRV